MPVEPNDSWPGRSLTYWHQLFHRMHRQRRMDHQHEGHRRGQRDRREVLAGIVGQLLVERGVGGQRAGRRHEQRVAVGRRLRRRGRRDHGAAAGAVLDDDRLAEPLLELRLELRARQDVHGAAGAERQDQRDRPGWIVVGAGGESLQPVKCRRSTRQASARMRMTHPPAGVFAAPVSACR